MAVPNINANTQVEMSDSCNCCWFFRRKKPKDSLVKITEGVYHKTMIQEEIQESRVEETLKDLQSGDHSRKG